MKITSFLYRTVLIATPKYHHNILGLFSIGAEFDTYNVDRTRYLHHTTRFPDFDIQYFGFSVFHYLRPHSHSAVRTSLSFCNSSFASNISERGVSLLHTVNSVYELHIVKQADFIFSFV